MNTTTATPIRKLSAALVWLVNGIQDAFATPQQMVVARQPAGRLSDRMLNDIGQSRFRELREVSADLAARGGRFPF